MWIAIELTLAYACAYIFGLQGYGVYELTAMSGALGIIAHRPGPRRAHAPLLPQATSWWG